MVDKKKIEVYPGFTYYICNSLGNKRKNYQKEIYVKTKSNISFRINNKNFKNHDFGSYTELAIFDEGNFERSFNLDVSPVKIETKMDGPNSMTTAVFNDEMFLLDYRSPPFDQFKVSISKENDFLKIFNEGPKNIDVIITHSCFSNISKSLLEVEKEVVGQKSIGRRIGQKTIDEIISKSV